MQVDQLALPFRLFLVKVGEQRVSSAPGRLRDMAATARMLYNAVSGSWAKSVLASLGFLKLSKA